MTSVQYSADRAADSKTIGWLGRLGLVAMGVSYGLVAILAIKLAFGDGGKATSRQGALETIAHDGFGRVLVLLLAIGFAGYALWRFAQALFDRGDAGDDAKGLAKRAGYAGRGLIYAGLCVTAVAILIGAHSSGGSSGTKKETAWVLDWPAGQWIVAAAGLAVLGAGIWNIVRGLTRKFKKQLDTASMSEVEEKAATTAGVAGLLARGVVFGLVGIFLVRAAWDYDPNKAIGIDGALRKLAAQSYGDALLGVVAAGLLLFGVFCLFQARYRKV